MCTVTCKYEYSNFPKFSDRQVWANSANPDQRSSLIRVCTRSSLIRVCTVCNTLCIFWKHYSKEKPSCSTLRVTTANFRVSKILEFLWYSTLKLAEAYEPPRYKTSKMTVRPAKIQISLGIRPVRSVFAQADLSLRWAHSHFVGFVMRQLKSAFWNRSLGI